MNSFVFILSSSAKNELLHLEYHEDGAQRLVGGSEQCAWAHIMWGTWKENKEMENGMKEKKIRSESRAASKARMEEFSKRRGWSGEVDSRFGKSSDSRGRGRPGDTDGMCSVASWSWENWIGLSSSSPARSIVCISYTFEIRPLSPQVTLRPLMNLRLKPLMLFPPVIGLHFNFVIENATVSAIGSSMEVNCNSFGDFLLHANDASPLR